MGWNHNFSPADIAPIQGLWYTMLLMRFENFFCRKSLAYRLLLIALFFFGLFGCTTLQAKPPFEVGQIYQVSDQTLLTLEDLTPHLVAADVIFLGEEHYTPSHLEAAQTILSNLLKHHRHPSLAMEMFSWDGQPGLDRYLHQPAMPLEQLVEESRWEQNWGGEFADYEPLVTFAKSQELDLLALNPPRPLVRLVAKQGLAKAMEDPEMQNWPIGKLVTDDAEYENLIFEQIESCHTGLPDHVYRRIFEASIFRDEGMAHIIKNYLDHKNPSEGPLVSYTGGGHIQYHIPIPKRVKRTHSSTKMVSIYFVAWDPSKEEEVRKELQNGIADFLWLTPLGPKGVQARCG